MPLASHVHGCVKPRGAPANMKNVVVEYFTVHQQVVPEYNIAAPVAKPLEFKMKFLHFLPIRIVQVKHAIGRCTVSHRVAIFDA